MDTWTWLEVIGWWLFAIDSAGYNLVAWCSGEWYERRFSGLARIFPVTKAYGALYGGLVIWLGIALQRAGVPVFGQ
tara:strand:+ start:544 stop:771 length:228 start_codon:yes stop_codon:yes gene_type:complete